MNTLRKSITFSILFVLFLANSAFAANGPMDTAKAAMTAAKTQGPKGVVDYIHWKSLYESMPAEVKSRAFNVNSPTELKTFYIEFFDNPGARIMKNMEKMAGADMPPEAQAMIRQQMQQLTAQMKQQLEIEQAKLKRTNFTFSNEQINGNKATVDVRSEVDGKSEKYTTNMINVNGRWLLTTMPKIGQGKGMGPIGAP